MSTEGIVTAGLVITGVIGLIVFSIFKAKAV
jgi:hypothetical protein